MHYRNVRDRAIKAFYVTMLQDIPFDGPYIIMFGNDVDPIDGPQYDDFYVTVECYKDTEKLGSAYIVSLSMTLDAFADVFDLCWKNHVLQWPTKPGTYMRHDWLGLLEDLVIEFDTAMLDSFRDYDTRFHFTEIHHSTE